jgi:colanic acid/amylovoran biosynthesis glycosyltransferase
MYFLKNHGIYFKYFILGEGREREHLMFLINELGLQEQIILCGRVNSVQINYHLGVTHLYLQTSLSEGFSNSCIEAQAFGIPCIVPAISGMSQCIEDGKTGIVVGTRNEKDYVDSIINLIKNYKFIDSGYISSRVKNMFSVATQREHWYNFFNSLFH